MPLVPTQVLTEALETCLGMLQKDSVFLRFINDALRAAASWQVVEAGLFCLKAVAGLIIGRLGMGHLNYLHAA